MSDLEGLLRDIQARPDDDGPRLVCADWHEENGDADRAAFIRAQIALARMSLWDPRRRALTRQEYDLFARHGKRWSAPLFGAVSRWQFRRGFVEQVKVEAGQFVKQAEMLWNLFPVREVKLNQPSRRELKKIAASPWLARVEKLNLEFGRIGNEGLRVLLGSPHISGLRGLFLKWCDLAPLGLRLLARAESLPALEALDLSSNEQTGPEGVAAFLTECRLPRLADLRWGYNQWSAGVCLALLASPLMPRIKVLDHFGHQTPDETIFTLLAEGRWTGLQELDTFLHQVTKEAIQRLAANRSFASLRKIRMDGPLGDAGLKVLLQAPLGAKLQELRLGDCGITSHGIQELAAEPRLAGVQLLELDGNPIGTAGCKALAESNTLTGLQGLGLFNCEVTGTGAKALADGLGERLGYLNLKQNGLFASRTRQLLERRFGEGLHGDPEERNWSPWLVAHARAHPPRCLSGFAVRDGTPLAMKLWKDKLAGEPEWLVLELAHPSDPLQRATLLGYREDFMLVSPIAVRWQPSGELVELFDAEQHGYLAEHDGNTTIHGSGRRVEWKCKHEGCRDHTLLAAFQYRDRAPERPPDRYFAPQEQFRFFYLYAWCKAHDSFQFISQSECK
jgi:uncharacterized protein (TIGR02996 family)